MTEIKRIINSGRKLAQKINFSKAVLGVSGGVDSALVSYLAVQIFGPENVFFYLLPENVNSTSLSAAQQVLDFLHVSSAQITTFPLQSLLSQIYNQLQSFDQSIAEINSSTVLRRGNLLARLRMQILFDQAASRQAIVLGTENLSEKNLGYFTLFGDSASIIELIDHLYKTEVKALAQKIFPPEIALKIPSADFWPNQTDEVELGFSYENADKIMQALWPKPIDNLQLRQHLLQNIPQNIIDLVLERCKSQQFKQEVPYSINHFF